MHTPKDAPCRIDALLVCDDALIGVVEQKSRFDLTLDRFRAPPPQGFGNLWLVTYSKLAAARALARALSVELFGFLWLARSRALLMQQLTEHGAWTMDFTTKRTDTRATINGGTATRANAFIDMSDCDVAYETNRTDGARQAPCAVALTPQPVLPQLNLPNARGAT